MGPQKQGLALGLLLRAGPHRGPASLCPSFSTFQSSCCSQELCRGGDRQEPHLQRPHCVEEEPSAGWEPLLESLPIQSPGRGAGGEPTPCWAPPLGQQRPRAIRRGCPPAAWVSCGHWDTQRPVPTAFNRGIPSVPKLTPRKWSGDQAQPHAHTEMRATDNYHNVSPNRATGWAVTPTPWRGTGSK